MTHLVSVTVEFDELEVPADDVKFHARRIRRLLRDSFPDAEVRVKASKLWEMVYDLDTEHSVRVGG